MLVKTLTFFMLWAKALGVPSNQDYTPNLVGVSSRDTLDTLLGINCRGSAFCIGCDHMKLVRDLIRKHTIPDDRRFKDGQQIACSECVIRRCSGVCAFMQYMGGKTLDARTIKGKIDELIRHKCKGCGSVPIYPGNNVKKGELTVNYVNKGCCERVCPMDEEFFVDYADSMG